jgi:DNA-binding MarR family transcriptional regulator
MIQQEAALNILRAADLILQDSAATLKPFDLTVAQFNVLRILRGAPEGLPSGQIGQRMINRDPDITRLLDRMELRQLIFRERSDHDRRVVTARITQNGLDLLKRADPTIADSHHRQFAGFTEKQLRHIIQLMAQISQQNQLQDPPD